MSRPMCFLLVAACLLLATPVLSADDRPNIVLIMVDDMGISDLGCYGGEIETPHLDRLAHNGLRFTQFYNCAKCETTRATLLSGLYAPEVGTGKLQNCTTIAEVMRSAGYTTLMTGKWHLSSSPIEKGFDRYFGHLSGATNFFTGDNSFRLDSEHFTVPESGFYTTDANADYAIDFLSQADPDRPFFLYIAHNAPHYPLHVPQAEFEKYRGRYRDGWDRLRETRLARMKELGIVSAETELSPRPDDVPAWESLSDEEQDIQELMMAAYAGMIDRVDRNIGRLVTYLTDTERLDNTLILFLSDNGACPFQRTKKETRENVLMPYDSQSYWTYDKGWAHACNTPFREYKRNQHEGGISTPLIAHWPAGITQSGTITQQPGHLVDIMATCLDLGEAEYPEHIGNDRIPPFRGRSLSPILKGQRRDPHDAIFFTFYGTHNALRVGDYKLVNKDKGGWELYNIAEDRIEQHDLSRKQVDRFRKLEAEWNRLSREVGIQRKSKDK